MDQQRIWQNRRALFTDALQRLDAQRLQRAVHLLAELELSMKQDYGQNLWPQLETLSLLLCHRDFPLSFTDV